MKHPFEGGKPQPVAQFEPCPECNSTKGYSRVGDYRVQCYNCNALLKNEEVGMQIHNEETT